MPLKVKDVRHALLSKGFEDRDGKDKFYHLWVNGKKTRVFTKISHGEQELHEGLLSAMSKQCCLTRSQFGDLIECPLTPEKYQDLLASRGVIDPPNAGLDVRGSSPSSRKRGADGRKEPRKGPK